MTAIYAIIGVRALYLLFAWLISAIICAELARRKGYKETNGLGTGLLLSVLGIPIWLFMPAREGSDWKLRRQRRASEAAAAADEAADKPADEPSGT